MSLLADIESLKQAALAELQSRRRSRRARPDQRRVGRPARKIYRATQTAIGSLPKEEKPAAGKAANQAKQELEAAVSVRRADLELKTALPKEPTDFTLPGRRRSLGKFASAHAGDRGHRAELPQNWVCRRGWAGNRRRVSLFRCVEYAGGSSGAGFAGYFLLVRRRAIASAHAHLFGPNPRDGETTAARAHYCAGAGLSPRQPRPDAQPGTFQQIEGLYVDKSVTVGDLKGTVEFVFRDFLLGPETKIRFRPHYFSYTEPSFEIDFSEAALTRKMGREWLEIAGCGMVHPQVFETVGYDPEVWTGWAFGFGIERIAMIRYGINDVRLFYENDIRFLSQF